MRKVVRIKNKKRHISRLTALTQKFFVMLSLPFHLAEALLGKQQKPNHRGAKLKHKYNFVAGKKKKTAGKKKKIKIR